MPLSSKLATTQRTHPTVGGELPSHDSPVVDPKREADRISGRRFVPPGVLVNAELQILQFRGATGPYLEPTSSKASLDLLKMVRQSLVAPLSAAINKAREHGLAVHTENVRLSSGTKTSEVSLEVIPLKNLKDRFYLIFFEEPQKTACQNSGASEPTANDEGVVAVRRPLIEVERELVETRDYLQSIQAQYEAANEELQTSNEEATSGNEELQSMNEELETSKEELESTNEELTTVNDEMVNRNHELNQLNSDLINLHASIQTPILVLGGNLTIRRFTPLAQQVFNLVASDVNRPLSGIIHNLVFPELDLFVAEVISRGTPQRTRSSGPRGQLVYHACAPLPDSGQQD